MKNKNDDKKAAAKAYVDTQLDTIRKYGKEAKISENKYKSIIKQVARASA
jgi:hypothetical protein